MGNAGNVENGIRVGMRGIWGIRVGIRGIKMGMRRISVGMQRIGGGNVER